MLGTDGARREDRLDAALAAYFVIVWGAGFLATKTGIQYAPPFTFLVLRFAFGILVVLPWLAWVRPRWPGTLREWSHVAVAGVLMHAVHLSGSHYAQYLGMSAGITALIMAAQPIVTAVIAWRLMGQVLTRVQWFGVAMGLAGVALVVWHKVDIRAVSAGSLLAVTTGLAAITVATLYQRHFCPDTDLRSATLVQFAVALVVLVPAAYFVEGFEVRWSWALFAAIAYLVILASIGAVMALHTLVRHGHAARATSIVYLTPIVAVILEWAMFGVVPTATSVAGIAVACAGVALVTRRAQAPVPPG